MVVDAAAKNQHSCGTAGCRMIPMNNRNLLYAVVGALVVVVAILGYNLYQAKKQPEGLQINLGPNGVKIENK
jgi:hypothetical protein